MGTSRDELFLKDLGTAIATVRKAHGLTQKVLAQKSGISLRYLILIEQGRVNMSILKLEKLCRSLEVKFADFYDYFT